MGRDWDGWASLRVRAGGRPVGVVRCIMIVTARLSAGGLGALPFGMKGWSERR
jgi:hypothetical protein